MFAVPGWAISASTLATQTSSRSQPEWEGAEPHAPISNSKKRKRDVPGPRLSAEDLDRLWNKQFGSSPGTPTVAAKAKKSNSTEEKVAKRKKPTHAPRTEPELEDEKSMCMDATIKEQSGRSGKREKAKQKQQSLHAGRQRDSQVSHKRLAPQPHEIETKDSDQANAGPAPQGRTTAPSASRQTRAVPPPQPAPPPPPSTNLTPLQAKMRNKLTSARFRHLNQTLYTTSSSDALQLFSGSPELFGEYHAGFSQQVKDSWPQNPVDAYIREIKERGKLCDRTGDRDSTVKLPLPRRKTGRCTIADLGCGDAALARACQTQAKALQLKFHNYDLHAPNSFVTKADIAKLPLRDGEIDVAVFCLSLMGTNWIDFVEDAWRVLRGDGKGEVWVAEVKSRFGRVKPEMVKNSVGNKTKAKKPKDKSKVEDGDGHVNGEELFVEDDLGPDQESDSTDISAFLDVFQRRGFSLREGSVNRTNKMFISAVFTKAGIPTAGKYKGWKWTGREYEKNPARHDGRMKFLDKPDEDVSPEEEARVLKPCVYKAR